MVTNNNTILIIVNILVSFLSPLILSISYYIKHISESSCCGSTAKLRESSELQIKKLSLENNKDKISELKNIERI